MGNSNSTTSNSTTTSPATFGPTSTLGHLPKPVAPITASTLAHTVTIDIEIPPPSTYPAENVTIIVPIANTEDTSVEDQNRSSQPKPKPERQPAAAEETDPIKIYDYEKLLEQYYTAAGAQHPNPRPTPAAARNPVAVGRNSAAHEQPKSLGRNSAAHEPQPESFAATTTTIFRGE